MTSAIERGAASIHIELSEGTITVTHGTDEVVLAQLKDAPEGTWDRMWDALETLGMERRVR